MIELFQYLTLFRTVVLSGRYGGGKTALAVWLALRLVALRHCSRIVSNMPLDWGSPGVEISISDVHAVEDCAIILDEAWLYLGAGISPQEQRAWFAFIRKRNQFLLLPSVRPLARDVSQYFVQRTINLMRFGVPCWVYRWSFRMGVSVARRHEESGLAVLWRPQNIFGVYDHGYEPGYKFWLYEASPASAQE